MNVDGLFEFYFVKITMWVSWCYSFFWKHLNQIKHLHDQWSFNPLKSSCWNPPRRDVWNPTRNHQWSSEKKLPTCVAELLVHQRQRWTHESKAWIFRISFWTFWRKCCWESCTRPGTLQGGPRADCYKWSYGAPVNGRKNHGFHWGYFTSITIYNIYNPRLPNTSSGKVFEVCVGGGSNIEPQFRWDPDVIRVDVFFFRSSPWNPTSRAIKLNIWPPSKPVWGRLVVEFPSYPKQNLGTFGNFGYLQAVLLVNFAGLLVFSYSWYRVL